jgi:acetyl esterase/lipase
MGLLGLIGCGLLLSVGLAARAADEAEFTQQQDVIYGHKWGMALTMDVFTPKQSANGAAVIQVVSGGWFSFREAINPAAIKEFLKRGYTVFAVCHGSQPKFTIPEIVEDMNRAVRFVRYHANDYKIDANRIGITGGSAGGHLSLMIGTAGGPGKSDAKDPVDQASSRVQAVACFFPPSDFLNWGKADYQLDVHTIPNPFKPALDFREQEKETRLFVPVKDDKTREILKQISPLTYANAETPPTLIIHGDADKLVPIQQAEIFINKLKELKVPAELVVKPGAGHGWQGIDKDIVTEADWFDKYLGKKEPKDN